MNALAVTYVVPFLGNGLNPVDFCRDMHSRTARYRKPAGMGDDLPSVRRIFERDGTTDDIS
jgi:hypothetical protein